MVIDLNLDPDDGMQQEGHDSRNQEDYEENVSATHSQVHDYNAGKKTTARFKITHQCADTYPSS